MTAPRLAGARVFVTGAGGILGGALAARLAPAVPRAAGLRTVLDEPTQHPPIE